MRETTRTAIISVYSRFEDVFHSFDSGRAHVSKYFSFFDSGRAVYSRQSLSGGFKGFKKCHFSIAGERSIVSSLSGGFGSIVWTIVAGLKTLSVESYPLYMEIWLNFNPAFDYRPVYKGSQKNAIKQAVYSRVETIDRYINYHRPFINDCRPDYRPKRRLHFNKVGVLILYTRG